MRKLILGAALLLASACSGSGKDRIADRVEENADDRAAAMDQASETMTNALQANATQQQASIVRSAGEDRADAIRDSDLDASARTKEQRNAIVAGHSTGTERAPRR
jgi:BioD-like phosphotransacetylase family protein